jgi:hypothetical protein
MAAPAGPSPYVIGAEMRQSAMALAAARASRPRRRNRTRMALALVLGAVGLMLVGFGIVALAMHLLQ